MHTRSSQLHLLALALSLGIISCVCGKEILTHTEPMGEKIVISCPFEDMPSWCFLPMEIQTENPGARPADWRVSLSSQDYRGGMNIRSGCNFRALPGNASRGSSLVPTGTVSNTRESGYSYGAYIGIEAARAGGGTGHGSINPRTSSQSDAEKTTLLSWDMRKVEQDSRGPLVGKLFDHHLAPVDWRAYCGFHSLHISDKEWQEMTPAAHTAIKHWVHLGGQLYVLGNNSAKSMAEMGLPKTGPGQRPGGVFRGSVNESYSDEEVKYFDKIADRDWVVRAITGDAVKEWERRDASSFATPSAQLAAGFMLFVVVGFAILVGPLNVFVFAAARRRHRLFITTPLISLGAGGLLVASVILSDGIGGKGVRYVWMESAPTGENTQYVVQHQHSRCGAMFSTGFEIPEDAYFAPMVLAPGELSGNLSAELEPGKVLASGPWFSSRRSQNFYLAAARPGRGRIEKTGTDERPVLTSAFDFPIGRIFWLAADGKTWWQAGSLAQGTATALQPCTAPEVQKALDDATALAPPEYARDLTTASRRPGYFIGLTERIAAIETHKSIRWQTHGFVTGPAVTP